MFHSQSRILSILAITLLAFILNHGGTNKGHTLVFWGKSIMPQFQRKAQFLIAFRRWNVLIPILLALWLLSACQNARTDSSSPNLAATQAAKLSIQAAVHATLVAKEVQSPSQSHEPTTADLPAPQPSPTPQTLQAPASLTNTPTSPPPTETPTATPKPTNTPIPSASVRKTVWLRTGPGAEYNALRKLQPGETIDLTGRNENGAWVQVETMQREIGWVFADFLNTGNLSISVLPHIPAPPLPACKIAVDGQFQSVYARDHLGCPIGAAHIIWAAWESFQRGSMLWRDDLNKVTIFYNGGGWQTVPDRWQGEPTPYRGDPPLGLRQPVRGFGWVWGRNDRVFNGIGWTTDEEKGVCLKVQDFQKGFIMIKSNEPYCTDHWGNNNFSHVAELPSLFIVAESNGRAWRTY